MKCVFTKHCCLVENIPKISRSFCYVPDSGIKQCVLCCIIIIGNSIALRGAHFGVGPGPINLDNVQCTGSETSLLDCTSSLQHNCGHFEDAGVVCPSNDGMVTIL